MTKRILYISALLLLLVSCNDYQQLLKNTDPDVKFTAAKNYFQEKDFSKSATLLEDIMAYYKGSSRSEEVLYLLAESYLGQEDYYSAAEYYRTYVKSYPRGEFAADCKYMVVTIFEMRGFFE